jgi:hypothetical protein
MKGTGALGGGANTALALVLAGGRLAIGAAIWAAPEPSMRALGFDPDDPQGLALGRLAATRDLAMGGLSLAALGDRRAARRLALVNAAVDAGDALAFGLALARREGGTTHGAAIGVPAGLLGAVAGLGLARRLNQA